jgi:allantoate deiminase
MSFAGPPGADLPLERMITARLEALGACSDEPDVLTRLYLGTAHRRAAMLVADWMREAGMTTRKSALGDVVGRYEAVHRGAGTLLLGSHIDTVRDAGKFDGALGVVTAIAVVERLHRAGRHLPFAIEVVAFGDEEGVRFPSTLGGSRALAGRFDMASLDERDGDGVSRREALLAFGCDPREIAAEVDRPANILGYVEVHIEQGRVLEAEGLPAAVVTAINGASRAKVTITGKGGHAGTLPMALRRDALAAAAEIVLAIERRAKVEADLVATVGRLDLAHPAINTVPGAASLSFDIRAPEDRRRQAAVRDILVAIDQIGRSRGVAARVEIGHDTPASLCAPHLCDALAASMTRLGLRPRSLPSGAGHDAMAFGGRIPFAMLFVRCRDGISHNPAEYASPEDIEIGARVLADFLDHFDASNVSNNRNSPT